MILSTELPLKVQNSSDSIKEELFLPEKSNQLSNSSSPENSPDTLSQKELKQSPNTSNNDLMHSLFMYFFVKIISKAILQFLLFINYFLFIMYYTNQQSYSSYQPVQTSTTNPSYMPYRIGEGFASTMTKSRILEQNKNAYNDALYNPLRTVVSSDPIIINSKYPEHIKAAEVSHVTHQYRPLTTQQFQNIKNNTYMIEKPLVPTDHFQRVEGKNFYVLDSAQRVGTPINQIQFRSRIDASRQKHIVIYDTQDSPIKIQNKDIDGNANVRLNEPEVPNKPILQKPRKTSKYNLYSCLDQPFERVKNFGCKGLTCPANQCVAARNQKDWFD